MCFQKVVFSGKSCSTCAKQSLMNAALDASCDVKPQTPTQGET